MTRHYHWLKYLIISIGIVMSFLLYGTFIVDDAFISFRYAENFSKGFGLVYNIGEPVEGYSNFFWVLLLSLFSRLGFSIPITAKILSAFSFVFLLGNFAKRMDEKSQNSNLKLAVLFLLSTFFPLVFYSQSGLETLLFAALLFFTYDLFIRSQYHFSAGVIGSMLILVLTRPEGILYCITLVGFAWWNDRNSRRYGLVFFLIFSFWIGLAVWRYFYFGLIVPNTFIAKFPTVAGSRVPWYLRGFDDIYYFFQSNGGWVSICLIVTFIFILRKSEKDDHLSLFLLVVGLLFQKYAGGDWMLGERYLLPVVSFLAWLIFRSLDHLIGSAMTHEKAYVGNLIIWGGIFFLNFSTHFEFLANQSSYPNFLMTSTSTRDFSEWIGKTYAGETILTKDIGAIGYYSKLPLIDTWGLVDQNIAKILMKQGGYNPNSQQEINQYIAQKKPDLLIEINPTKDSVMVKYGSAYRLIGSRAVGNSITWYLWKAVDSTK